MNWHCGILSAIIFGNFLSGEVQAGFFSKKLKVESFSLDSCNADDDIIQIKQMNISSSIEGHILLSGEGLVLTTLEAPLKIGLKVEKQLLGTYFKFGCFNQVFGSCIYHDVCEFLSNEENCNLLLDGQAIRCTCPTQEGKYSLPSTKIGIDVSSLAFMLRGQYRGQITAYQQDKPVSCYNFSLTLS